jgi:uncharacterized protein (UPF0218 family)
MTLKITEKQRKELKIPFGPIVKGIKKEKFTITVGDYCSLQALKEFVPDLIIYDGKIKRKASPEVTKEIEKTKCKTIEVENKAGTISDETWIAIELALKEPSKIKVNGEEDLLVIPCIDLAKETSVIYYGQPDNGVVRIEVNKTIKEKIKKIINEMERVI